MKLSSSHRAFLQKATIQYSQNIDQAEEYLATRGLSVEEARAFGLGVVVDPLPSHEAIAGRLTIPYITPSGVVDLRTRAMHGEEPKYLGLPGAETTMFNTNAIFTATKYICLTEGEFDCILMTAKTQHPTVGIPGASSWKPHYARILDDFDIVIVLADGDKAGSEMGKKVGRELSNVNVIPMPDGEDVNSVILKYGKDWIDERINECVTAG